MPRDQPNSVCSGSISSPGSEAKAAAPTIVTKVTTATAQARCTGMRGRRTGPAVVAVPAVGLPSVAVPVTGSAPDAVPVPLPAAVPVPEAGRPSAAGWSSAAGAGTGEVWVTWTVS